MNRWIPAALLAAAVTALPILAQDDHANCAMHQGQKTEPAAAKSAYTDRTSLPIKALSADQIEQYRSGKGMGLAIPAELNGYPGPRHVLDLASQLELTEAQRTRMQALFDSMKTDAVRLGGEIVSLEARLDAAFAAGTISREELQSLTSEIAERQGELRLAHLETHIAARAILTPAQVAAYNKARGY